MMPSYDAMTPIPNSIGPKFFSDDNVTDWYPLKMDFHKDDYFRIFEHEFVKLFQDELENIYVRTYGKDEFMKGSVSFVIGLLRKQPYPTAKGLIDNLKD